MNPGLSCMRSVLLGLMMILAGCSGGVSGIMTSTAPGYWQIYRINYQAGMAHELQTSIEVVLEEMFLKLGYKQRRSWGSPLLAEARVSSFRQNYRGNLIEIKVEIRAKYILMLSTSYTTQNKYIFDKLESVLRKQFGNDSVESCYGVKDIHYRTCLDN